MFLKDPCTGEPSLAFTMYALECEGELDNEQEEDADDIQFDESDE